mmetsp:Transcript_8897/g.21888  ORF Transcript_8897/g.21888 Transcript_8897/m.21888 type:complete len:201 (-) Transcript_8897:400-1002(-)
MFRRLPNAAASALAAAAAAASSSSPCPSSSAFPSPAASPSRLLAASLALAAAEGIRRGGCLVGLARAEPEEQSMMKTLQRALEKSQRIPKEEYPHMAGALTLGGLAGYCTGATVRVFGRGASILFGLTFIGLQTASYYGFVTVHWQRVEQAFIKMADLDGDGKLDEEDLEGWVSTANQLITHNFTLGGFGVGFLAGLRRG